MRAAVRLEPSHRGHEKAASPNSSLLLFSHRILGRCCTSQRPMIRLQTRGDPGSD